MLSLLIFVFFVDNCYGFNVSMVEQLSDEIVKLMDFASERNDRYHLVRLIATYAGGMCRSRLSIEKPGATQEIWSVCKGIYEFGKPDFIDHNFDLNKMKQIFHWNEEDKLFFESIWIDARKAWEDFENTFRKAKNKYLSMENY